ncbi:MAG: penicillin-binding protein 2 [Nitrospirota bacterium]|nr:penicillin-binding protein 2 [Nitrospirota bacterium]
MITLERDALGWTIRQRLALATVVITLGFVSLLSRSWFLQVLQHEKYLKLATSNRIREVVEPSDRGLIFDRAGRQVVINTPTFSLALVLDDIKDLNATADQVGEMLGLDAGHIKEQARRQRRSVPYLPVTVQTDLTMDQVAEVEWARLPGVRVVAETRRQYPYGNAAAHVLGYVSEVTEKQLGDNAFLGVLPGAQVGQYGVERSYDAALRGVDGARQIEVDAQGFETGEIERQPPVVGNDLYLSIDMEVQRVAEEALGDRAGAVIAIDPRNGQVLALVSHPEFSPDELARGVDSKRWKEIITDPERPLFNRVLQGTYPPGSVFKIPVAAAVLEKFHGGQDRFCIGQYRFGNRTFRDWKKQGHGLVDLYQAVVQSCDVFFYQYGDELGVDAIADFATRFGLGKLSGIDLGGESPGLIPSTEWKKRARGQVWYPGETLSVVIGQGYVSTTPLQIAQLMAAVGMNGQRFVPRVQLGVWDSQLDALKPAPSRRLQTVELSPSTYTALHAAMAGVVVDPHGTAHAARSKLVTVAGKTGTAQVVSQSDEMREMADDKVPLKLRDHAWFAAFAPVDNPVIAVGVLVEHGAHGGGASAPVARQVIESYITQRGLAPPDEELYKVLEQRHREREAT